ncbi:MAG: hypothetical protein ACOYON_14350 [Fimbriimonas sp.]
MKSWCLAIFLAAFAVASADMMGPSLLPFDRIIKNLESRVAKNSNDAEARYLLGRTYYATFCTTDRRAIYLYGTEDRPRFPSVHPSIFEFRELKARTDPAGLNRIRQAIKHLKKAVELRGGEPGLYPLTLACAYEASAPIAQTVDKRATPEKFRQFALTLYAKSYEDAKAKDRTRGHPKAPMTWEKWISVEAAEGVLRLDPQSPLKSNIQEHLKFLETLPPAPITPIVFHLTRSKSLASLLDLSRTVEFDLAGNGSRQLYGWVKPDTAFLVWQPDPSKPIRSGRQLFGSATWYLMPANGYSALALLDDDGDGWVSGPETHGLAVWRDANQNGIAEPAEVLAIEKTPIQALKTSISRRQGASYVSDGGLRLTNGRLLPTYDWVTQPVRSRLTPLLRTH